MERCSIAMMLEVSCASFGTSSTDTDLVKAESTVEFT